MHYRLAVHNTTRFQPELVSFLVPQGAICANKLCSDTISCTAHPGTAGFVGLTKQNEYPLLLQACRFRGQGQREGLDNHSCRLPNCLELALGLKDQAKARHPAAITVN